jgi:glycosyltransferase involved in cell wall biosynthesis
MRPPLRIACTGLVAADHGSVSSAGFEVLRELLQRGHQVDFFSKQSYVYPVSLIEHHGLVYVNCDQPRLDGVTRRLGSGPLGWVGGKLGHRPYARRIIRSMRSHHAERPYDVALFLGVWAHGRVGGLRAISWVQGPPGTDARSIRRHRREIVRLCGAREYALLRAYAIYRSSSLGHPPFKYTDVCVCGSRESARTMVDSFGFEAARVRALPYPIDLDAFAPAGPARPVENRPELLWVGRVVPRKRLDLFLDAGALLIANGWDIELTVVGGFAFAQGYRKLIEQFPYPDRLTYMPRIPREEVAERLRSAAVLVQPSEEENFGSSVAEALACGTPVVVGPTNGTGDYVGAGGRPFDEYTPESVAAAITRALYDLARDPPRVAAEARQAAVDHLAVEQLTDDLEGIMRALVPPGRP